jgi:hypothetical protein
MDVEGESWPGVTSAQAFVLPSYQWAMSRYEAADARIQTLLTFVTTVTFAVPTLCRALRPDLALNSPWFVKALLVATVIIGVGLVTRLRGGLILLSPMTLHRKWLGLDAAEFQRNVLYFAGEHFEANLAAVNRKANAEVLMAVGFAAELALFFAWVVTG